MGNHTKKITTGSLHVLHRTIGFLIENALEHENEPILLNEGVGMVEIEDLGATDGVRSVSIRVIDDNYLSDLIYEIPPTSRPKFSQEDKRRHRENPLNDTKPPKSPDSV